MILIDTKEKSENKALFKGEIERLGVPCELTSLPHGDFCFEGNGPEGLVSIGIERKALHDLLNCIDDGSLLGEGGQLGGMKQLYALRVVMVEGHWKPHESGFLMEGFSGGMSWGYMKHHSSKVMYAKMKRFLISVSISGAIVDYSRDPAHTAYNVVEWYHYFQKRWSDHRSNREIPKVAIPTLSGRPPLVRRWANDLEGIGEKLGDLAARHFITGDRLAEGDEMEWLKIPGVGVKLARDVVREIHGYKR